MIEKKIINSADIEYVFEFKTDIHMEQERISTILDNIKNHIVANDKIIDNILSTNDTNVTIDKMIDDSQNKKYMLIFLYKLFYYVFIRYTYDGDYKSTLDNVLKTIKPSHDKYTILFVLSCLNITSGKLIDPKKLHICQNKLANINEELVVNLKEHTLYNMLLNKLDLMYEQLILDEQLSNIDKLIS